MNKKISEDDIKAWNDFVSSDKPIENKDKNLEAINKNIGRIKKIDLHGYTLDEANKAIENFIFESFLENVNKLIVVTGKGLHSDNEKDPYVSKDLGILKYSVPEFILNNNSLMTMINEITDAKIEDGGGGAFYIFLKKNKSIK